MPMYLNANHKAWELDRDGSWSLIKPKEGEALRRPQFQFEALANKEYEGTALAFEGISPQTPTVDFLALDEGFYDAPNSTGAGTGTEGN